MPDRVDRRRKKPLRVSAWETPVARYGDLPPTAIYSLREFIDKSRHPDLFDRVGDIVAESLRSLAIKKGGIDRLIRSGEFPSALSAIIDLSRAMESEVAGLSNVEYAFLREVDLVSSFDPYRPRQTVSEGMRGIPLDVLVQLLRERTDYISQHLEIFVAKRKVGHPYDRPEEHVDAGHRLVEAWASITRQPVNVGEGDDRGLLHYLRLALPLLELPTEDQEPRGVFHAALYTDSQPIPEDSRDRLGASVTVRQCAGAIKAATLQALKSHKEKQA